MEVRSFEISGIVKGGRGLARTDTGPVFVEGALPGEIVRAEVTERKRSWSSARTVEVIRPAPERTLPTCPHYTVCGGCDWQHIEYSSQVRFKEHILAECLRRIARISPAFLPSITGAPLGYRWRVRLQTNDRGHVGFFRRASRHVIPVEACPVLAEELNKILPRLRDCGGLLPQNSELSLGLGEGGVLASVNGALRGTPGELLAAAGLSGCELLGGGTVGDAYLRLVLDGLGYRIRPGGFFQANWGLNRELVRTVAASVPEGGRVLDLFSGAGNFTLYLAARGCAVVAVEGDAALIEDARRSARDNGLTGIRFLRRDLSGRRTDLSGVLGEGLDAVVMDPPRGGVHPALVSWLVESSIPTIQYVSCDPATLARDLSRFGTAYRVESVRVADLFPQTSHVESIAVLKRN